MSSSGKDHAQRKDHLLTEFNSLIKQCQNRFINRYELATECENIVITLCSSIEQIFCHGLKKFINKKKIIPLKNDNITFWDFISFYLSEHEINLLTSLQNVHTNLGRGRSWIRNCLNEHSLEKYFLIICADSKKNQFYHEYALLNDERSDQLCLASKSLNSILFALNIDTSDLDYDYSSLKNNLQSDLEHLVPIITNSNSNVLLKSINEKCNMIFLDGDEDMETKTQNIYAKSAPVSSFLKFEDQSDSDAITLKSDSSSRHDLSIDSKLYVMPTESFKMPSSCNSICSEENKLINSLRERISALQIEKEKLEQQNNMITLQLKKYISTIELIKYNNSKIDKSDSINEFLKNTEETNDDEKKFRDYEKKLIQVSEMHGEVVEFNEHLYKVIQLKDSLISRLRNELVELRGPLPNNDDIISVVSETETNSHSLQSLFQPLIHVWIPTAFLSGGFKGKSHHIYQIYIRIKEEEWNVYRRYSQFYNLHKMLKQKHSSMNQFEFPPKKAIGNKDSRIVQERRKKLESYLRNIINYIQSQHNDIVSKEKLIEVLPFLSDKYFMQERSQSETNLATNNQPSASHYMGF